MRWHRCSPFGVNAGCSGAGAAVLADSDICRWTKKIDPILDRFSLAVPSIECC